MAAITNTMDRVISNSRRQNQIFRILTKSLLLGMAGYLLFILTFLGGFELISNFLRVRSDNISNPELVLSIISYLALYSYMLIKEMRRNNFCK